MRVETKSALILVGTLVLGLLLGVVGAGALAGFQAGRLDRLRRPPGFVAHMERVIRPRDAAQDEAIRSHLEETARQNERIIRGAHDQLRSALDEMRARLTPLLDAAQRERLDAIGRLDDSGPPPFPPPRG